MKVRVEDTILPPFLRHHFFFLVFVLRLFLLFWEKQTGSLTGVERWLLMNEEARVEVGFRFWLYIKFPLSSLAISRFSFAVFFFSFCCRLVPFVFFFLVCSSHWVSWDAVPTSLRTRFYLIHLSYSHFALFLCCSFLVLLSHIFPLLPLFFLSFYACTVLCTNQGGKLQRIKE